MSSDVISRSGPSTSAISRFRADTSARVATAISIGGTPPRSLTSSASGSFVSPSASSSRFAIVAASSAIGRYAIFSAPGSPWIPRPSSTSSAPMRASAGWPGIVHEDSEIPSDRTLGRDALRRRLHLAQRSAGPRDVTRDLVHEQRPRQAARSRRVRDRDVVGDHDHLHLDAQRTCPLGREPEVQTIARVVLHDQEAPRVAGGRQDPGEHRIDARRREDLAADRRGQHPFADEAGVRRLVTCSTARDERDLRAIGVGPDQHLDRGIAVEARELALAEQDRCVEGLGDDVVTVVDEVLHRGHPATMRVGWARPADGMEQTR